MKGFTKNKYVKTAICFGVGAVLLTAAVFANYDNANGYSVCKGAVKGLLFETNFTANYQMDLKLDGESLSHYEGVHQTNGGGDPARYNSSTDTSRYELGGETVTSSQEYINQGDQSISIYTRADGTKESYASKIYPNIINGVEEKEDGSLIGNRGDMVERAINFGEKLCDTLVGDLKNSFILSENKDGIRTYDVSLTGSQMPDLVSAGTSLLVSSMKESVERNREYREQNPEYYQGEQYRSIDDLFYENLFMGGDPMIDSVNGTMSVNEKDQPTLMKGALTVTGYDESGQSHTMEVSVEIKLSDYGTTSIQPVDVNSLPNLQINDRSRTTFVLNTAASDEEQQEIRERADEYASYGNTVTIVDQNGSEIAVLSGAETENPADEKLAEAAQED